MRDSPDTSAGHPVSRAGIMLAAVICASVVVSHIFGRISYSLLLPAISDDLVDSFTGAGFLGASYFAGYLLGVIGVTAVSSRIEPLTLLRTGLGLSAMALAALATATEFSVLSTGVFFAGTAGAAIWIPAPVIATSGLPARHRGLVMGALTASMGAGLLLVSQGTALYRSVVDDEGVWRPIFAIEAAIAALVLLLVLVVARESKQPAAPLTRDPQTDLTEQPTKTAQTSRMFDMAGLRSIPRWRQLLVAYTVFALLAGSWSQFLGLAMEEDAGFSRSHVTNLYSALAVGAVPGPLLLGRLSDRIGRDRSISIACGMCAASSLLVTIGSEPFATIASFLYGAGSFAIPPLTAAAVRDHLDGRLFAATFGAMTIIYAISSMIASQLAGVLADASGSFTLVYMLLAGAALVAGAAAEARRRALPAQFGAADAAG